MRNQKDRYIFVSNKNKTDMTTYTQKIENINYLNAEINSQENSGYKQCKRTDDGACLRVTYKERGFEKRQKTVYFKSEFN